MFGQKKTEEPKLNLNDDEVKMFSEAEKMFGKGSGPDIERAKREYHDFKEIHEELKADLQRVLENHIKKAKNLDISPVLVLTETAQILSTVSRNTTRHAFECCKHEMAEMSQTLWEVQNGKR